MNDIQSVDDGGIGTLSRSAEVRGIRCIEVSARVLDTVALASAEIAKEYQIVTEMHIDDSGNLIVRVSYSVPMMAASVVAAQVDCQFQIAYWVPEGTSHDAAQVARFSADVVLPTLHPYVRETLDSMYARIGVRPPLMGPLRLDNVRAERRGDE